MRMTPDEAMPRLLIKPDYDAGDGPGPHVHTFHVVPRLRGYLGGAHISVTELLAEMTQFGVEEATDTRLYALGHTLVIKHPDGDALYLETKK
jgi:hypothetical protein